MYVVSSSAIKNDGTRRGFTGPDVHHGTPYLLESFSKEPPQKWCGWTILGMWQKRRKTAKLKVLFPPSNVCIHPKITFKYRKSATECSGGCKLGSPYPSTHYMRTEIRTVRDFVDQFTSRCLLPSTNVYIALVC